MSHRYGTRLSTKAARSGLSTNADPPTPQQPATLIDFPQAVPEPGIVTSDRSGQSPLTGTAAQPPRADGSRKPLVPPVPTKQSASGYPPRLFPSATPPVAASPSIGTENRPPSGGSIGGDRRRKRSRLSLVGKRRASPVQQQGVVGSGSPVDGPTSCASQESGSRPCRLPTTPPPPVDANGDDAVVGCYPGGVSPRLTIDGLNETGAADAARRRPWCPVSENVPLPPFVGLKNLGETCYVNAVLQALTACRRALRSNRGADRAGSREEKMQGRQDEAEMPGPRPAAPSEAAGVVDPVLAEGICAARGVGKDGNPVPHAMGELLERMEKRNRELFQQESGAPSPQIAARSPSALSLGGPTSSEVSELAAETGLGNDAAAVTPEASHPPNETPLRPGNSVREDPHPRAFAPNALVELIREGWLSNEHTAGEAISGRARLLQGIGGPAGSTDFGTGQACVSEFLGKVLHYGASGRVAGAVPGEASGDRPSPGGVSAGDAPDDVCGGLAESFRGALCCRTLCVECERDRTTHEDFVELMLPPLVPTRLLPSSPGPKMVPNGGAATTRGGREHPKSPAERRTLQSLVDEVLGRESLEGSNKVWCEACRQWTEAERRSSLHSPPGVLALHVRPGIGKQASMGRYPTIAIASDGCLAERREAGDGGKSDRWYPSKAEGGSTGGDGDEQADDYDNQELIERLLVVEEASRCQFHRNVVAGLSVGAGGASANTRPCDSGDALYDLVGAILHQGQSLGSGHYTFALHVENGVPTASPRHRSPPAAGEIDSNRGYRGSGARSSSQGQEDAEGNPKSSQVVPACNIATSCAKPASLALFDDDVVRWLTPNEVRAVLRGGGAGLGEPFLVFYARRP
ncbi:unnamed protein product [Scytosiphon promiscuus]